MKAPPLAKNYKCLTPEERFRLILAASGRGDEVEKDRLVNAGGRIALSMPDHSPFAHAFNELSLLTFIELLDDAAFYQRCFDFAENAAFVPEGFLRWFNRVRSAGELALTTAPLTIEGVADEIAEAFRQRVQWWGA